MVPQRYDVSSDVRSAGQRMLICPVRGCGSPLIRDARGVSCERKHSFDIARSGYLNLLQPQDRRSKQPGDSAEVVAARRRLHDRGVTAPLLEGIAEALQATGGLSSEECVLDAGCGEGFYLGNLARRFGCNASGVDISIPAVNAAAKRYPEPEWIVANADRMIPYANASFSTVLSITGRMNPVEFQRVLKDGGRLLVAVAAPDDLIELRGKGRDRVERTLKDFAEHFQTVDQRRVTTVAELDAAGVADVLVSIYRPLGQEHVAPLQVTLSLDLLVLEAFAS